MESYPSIPLLYERRGKKRVEMKVLIVLFIKL